MPYCPEDIKFNLSYTLHSNYKTETNDPAGPSLSLFTTPAPTAPFPSSCSSTHPLGVNANRSFELHYAGQTTMSDGRTFTHVWTGVVQNPNQSPVGSSFHYLFKNGNDELAIYIEDHNDPLLQNSFSPYIGNVANETTIPDFVFGPCNEDSDGNLLSACVAADSSMSQWLRANFLDDASAVAGADVVCRQYINPTITQIGSCCSTISVSAQIGRDGPLNPFSFDPYAPGYFPPINLTDRFMVEIPNLGSPGVTRYYPTNGSWTAQSKLIFDTLGAAQNFVTNIAPGLIDIAIQEYLTANSITRQLGYFNSTWPENLFAVGPVTAEMQEALLGADPGYPLSEEDTAAFGKYTVVGNYGFTNYLGFISYESDECDPGDPGDPGEEPCEPIPEVCRTVNGSYSTSQTISVCDINQNAASSKFDAFVPAGAINITKTHSSLTSDPVTNEYSHAVPIFDDLFDKTVLTEELVKALNNVCYYNNLLTTTDSDNLKIYEHYMLQTKDQSTWARTLPGPASWGAANPGYAGGAATDSGVLLEDVKNLTKDSSLDQYCKNTKDLRAESNGTQENNLTHLASTVKRTKAKLVFVKDPVNDKGLRGYLIEDTTSSSINPYAARGTYSPYAILGTSYGTGSQEVANAVQTFLTQAENEVEKLKKILGINDLTQLEICSTLADLKDQRNGVDLVFQHVYPQLTYTITIEYDKTTEIPTSCTDSSPVTTSHTINVPGKTFVAGSTININGFA